MGPNRNETESGTAVPLTLPSLSRQLRLIRANNGGLSRMRIRRWQACTNMCEPSRTWLQSPCKRKVDSSILTEALLEVPGTPNPCCGSKARSAVTSRGASFRGHISDL
jgi:hypothetical protein